MKFNSRKLREKQAGIGLSNQEIAKKLKQHVNTYQKTRWGNREPSLKELSKIALILKCAVSALID